MIILTIRDRRAAGRDLHQRERQVEVSVLGRRHTRPIDRLSTQQGRHPLAAPYVEKSIALLREINAENELALAYTGYGRLQKHLGERAQAQAYLTQALTIFKRLGTLREPDKV